MLSYSYYTTNFKYYTFVVSLEINVVSLFQKPFAPYPFITNQR